MNMEKLSIVIPLYNKERNIERTIDSVLRQTVADWTLYVVNDGSTDSGPAIVEAMEDHRIKLIHQENAGVSAARNTGIEAAGEGLVAFLDADDFWDPPMLEEMRALREQFPEAGMYATGYRRINEHGKGYSISVDPSGGERQLVPDYIRRSAYGNFVHTSSVMLTYEALNAIGGFPVGEKFGEDLCVWAKASMSWPLACSARICGNYYCDSQDVAPRHAIRYVRSPLIDFFAECLNSNSYGSQSELDFLLSIRARLWQYTGYLLRGNSTLSEWKLQPAFRQYAPVLVKCLSFEPLSKLLGVLCGLHRRGLPSSKALRRGSCIEKGLQCLRIAP